MKKIPKKKTKTKEYKLLFFLAIQDTAQYLEYIWRKQVKLKENNTIKI